MANPVIRRPVKWDNGLTSKTVTDGTITYSDRMYVGDMQAWHVEFQTISSGSHDGVDGTTDVEIVAEDGTVITSLSPVNISSGTLSTAAAAGADQYSVLLLSASNNPAIFLGLMASAQWIKVVFVNGDATKNLTVQANILGSPIPL